MNNLSLNNRRTHLLFLLLSFLAVIAASFAISLATAHVSHAAENCSGKNSGMCLGLKDSWGSRGGNSSGGLGGGSSSGGGGSSSGNNISKPPVISKVCGGENSVPMYYFAGKKPPAGYKVLNGCLPIKKMTSTWFPMGTGSFSGNCSPITRYGVKIKAKGYWEKLYYDLITRKSSDHDTLLDPANKKMYYAWQNGNSSIDCVYPKLTQSTTTYNCLLNTSAYMERLNNSYAGYKKFKTVKKTSATKAQLASGEGNCETSASLSYNQNPGTGQANWGQYKLHGAIKFVKCTRITVTFDGKSTKQYNCGATQTQNSTAQGTIWCAGWTNGQLLNKDWHVNDCYNRANGGYTCKVPTPTYDKKTGTIQTMRDGKNRVLAWGKPTTGGGIVSTSNWKQKISVLAGSTPRNTAVSDNNKTSQLFWSNRTFGSWIAKGGISANDNQNMAFYTASNPNGSWKAQRELKFDAKVKTNRVDFTGAKVTSSKISVQTSTSSMTITQKNVKCATATSPKIQPVRTIGDQSM